MLADTFVATESSSPALGSAMRGPLRLPWLSFARRWQAVAGLRTLNSPCSAATIARMLSQSSAADIRSRSRCAAPEFGRQTPRPDEPRDPVENARQSGRRNGAADSLASSRAMVYSCGMPSPSRDAGLEWDALRTATHRSLHHIFKKISRCGPREFESVEKLTWFFTGRQSGPGGRLNLPRHCGARLHGGGGFVVSLCERKVKRMDAHHF